MIFYSMLLLMILCIVLLYMRRKTGNTTSGRKSDDWFEFGRRPISYNWHTNFDTRATICAVCDRFSLRILISAIFILPAEVMVTDSESHAYISYLSLIVTMAVSGLVSEM